MDQGVPLGHDSGPMPLEGKDPERGAPMLEVLRTELRFLAFRSIRPDLKRHGSLYLALGLGAAWLVGIGRYWHHPTADWWQYLGLGSLIYVPAMALILWLLLWPLRPRDWRYRNVLTFVGMTAPPGLLYAIPVERMFSLDASQAIKGWLLAVVAAWRVALLVSFVVRSAGFRGMKAAVAVLLPLALIVTTLTMLNLEHVVMDAMGGFLESTPNDTAYVILFLLSVLSFVLSPAVLIPYVVLVYRGRWRRKATTPSDSGGHGSADRTAA